MNLTVTVAKVIEMVSIEIIKEGEIMSNLLSGNLYKSELLVRDVAHEIFNGVMGAVLVHAAKAVNTNLWVSYEDDGMRNFEFRPLEIELHTGHRVVVDSMYAKRIDISHQGSRHLLARQWSLSANCSPLRVSQVSMIGAICPSYDIGNEVVKTFGSRQSTSRIRKIIHNFSDWCYGRDTSLVLAPGETLSGKRVVISIDGGRTRTKEYKVPKGIVETKNRRKCSYETPWREPKMFVIQTLTESGEIDRKELPIYGTRFGEEDVMKLLSSFLVALQIKDAKGVQIVADGAPWIWNNVKTLLIQAGVNESKIVETLDYPHASEYLTKLIEKMPKRVSATEKKSLYTEFKTWLWEGNVLQVVEKCHTIFKRPSQEIRRWINYLEKHAKKTQYAHFESVKWCCGSGIVESGIRRIINLRFKNASTFWYKDNVEKLFLLRSVCLAKRWDIFMQNFVNLEHN
jgi:hypothetical protein